MKCLLRPLACLAVCLLVSVLAADPPSEAESAADPPAGAGPFADHRPVSAGEPRAESFPEADPPYAVVPSSAGANLPRDWEQRHRQIRVGPFFEWSRDPRGNSFVAVRPLFSMLGVPSQDQRDTSLVWPLYFRQRRGTNLSSHGLFYAFRRYVRDLNDPESPRQLYLLPFYFQGRARAGFDYWCLFPFWGRIADFAGTGDVRVRLFPLYLRAQKAELTSTHWFWPIYNNWESHHHRKRRLFPFYGWHEYVGRYKVSFALWPIFLWVESLDPEATAEGWSVLPFWGSLHYRSPNGRHFLDSYTTLWPFFSWIDSSAGRRRHLPWPFLRFEDRPAAQAKSRHYWPLYGDSRRPGHRRTYWLWPIVQRSEDETSRGHERQFLVAPVYSSMVRRDHDGELRSEAYKVWPLYSAHATPETRSLRVLSLWPFADAPPVERNWAPLWTLYGEYHAPEVHQREALLGLVNYRRDPVGVRHNVWPLYYRQRSHDREHRRWQVLLGLYGQEFDEGERKTRLLWFFRF